MNRRTAFLMYHEIESPERPDLCDTDPGYVRYVVYETDFRAHVSTLKNDGVRGMAVGSLLHENGSSGSSSSSSSREVVMTFDDGCETDLTVAAPILGDAGFGATFYVTVDHLGKRGYLSRPQLRELADLDGFEIGSHAMTHRYLHDLPTDEIDQELTGSKKELEDITGKSVGHFSCPGGRWDQRVSSAAQRAGYESLVTSAIGMNTSRTDPFRLTRVAAMRGMSAGEVARITRGDGLLRKRAQSAVLDAAKHTLGNARYERVRGIALRAISRVR